MQHKKRRARSAAAAVTIAGALVLSPAITIMSRDPFEHPEHVEQAVYQHAPVMPPATVGTASPTTGGSAT